MADREQKIPPENNPLDLLHERLEMRVPARAEWVRVVRLATAGVASRVGFSYDDVEDIKLAVAEACNNAIIHSTPGAGASFITVFWQILQDGVRISISDEGRLDPPGLPQRQRSTPLGDSLDDLPESGMGLLLIESLMDEVEHESGLQMDTTIHMTKRLTPSAKGQITSRPDPDAPVALRPMAKKLRRTGASHPIR